MHVYVVQWSGTTEERMEGIGIDKKREQEMALVFFFRVLFVGKDWATMLQDASVSRSRRRQVQDICIHNRNSISVLIAPIPLSPSYALQ
jgi:hypothetical protein